MPLHLVIGYTDRSFNPETAKPLYIGGDGVKAKDILAKENSKYPVRERFVRPQPNGGRRIDASAREEDAYVPDLGLDVEAAKPESEPEKAAAEPETAADPAKESAE